MSENYIAPIKKQENPGAMIVPLNESTEQLTDPRMIDQEQLALNPEDETSVAAKAFATSAALLDDERFKGNKDVFTHKTAEGKQISSEMLPLEMAYEKNPSENSDFMEAGIELRVHRETDLETGASIVLLEVGTNGNQAFRLQEDTGSLLTSDDYGTEGHLTAVEAAWRIPTDEEVKRIEHAFTFVPKGVDEERGSQQVIIPEVTDRMKMAEDHVAKRRFGKGILGRFARNKAARAAATGIGAGDEIPRHKLDT